MNRTPTRRFKPTRGLRRGNALSPFLVLNLCRRFISIDSQRDNSEEKYIAQKYEYMDQISHLFFVNHSLLFTKGNLETAHVIKEILSHYEQASRQRINYQKSSILFGK